MATLLPSDTTSVASSSGSGGGGFFHGLLGGAGDPIDWTLHEGSRFAGDLENAAIGAVTGTYKLAHDALAPGYHPSWSELGQQWGQFVHDPLSVFDAQSQAHDALNQDITGMYHATVQSLQPHEILVHPGNALLTGLLLYGGAGGLAGRVGEGVRIATSEGALPAKLAASMDKIRPAYPNLSDYELAAKLGQADTYTRTFANRAGTVRRSVGSQLYDTLAYGLPEKQRLLYDSPMKLEDWLLQDPARIPQAGWKYSRNAGIRGAQNLIDELHHRFPDETTPPLFRALMGRSQSQRIASAARQMKVVENNMERQLGKELFRKWGGVENAKHMAARLVLEGTLPDDAIAKATSTLKSGALNERMAREMQRYIDTINEARPLLGEETHHYPGREAIPLEGEPEIAARDHTVPVPADEELQKYVDDLRTLSNKRSFAARMGGFLSHESKVARDVGPLNYIRYGEIPERLARLHRSMAVRQGRAGRGDLTPEQLTRNQQAISALQARINRATGKLSDEEKANLPQGGEIPIGPHEAEWLSSAANLARVPYEIEKARPFYGAFSFRRAYRGRGGKPPPSTFTHPFKAGVLAHGGGDLNVAKLMAESYTEAHRYIAFQNFAKKMYAEGHDTPESIPPQYRTLMKNPELKGIPSLPYQAAENQAFDVKATIAQAKQYEALREEHFPKTQEFLRQVKGFTAEQVNRLITNEGEGQYRAVHGYRWVDSRRLGGLNKQNPLLGAMEYRSVRGIIHFFDLVNAAQKASLLYLKPAYAVPNMLGNVFLNLVQQGPLAPYNMALSVAAHRYMDVETLSRLKAAMGEGSQDVLRPQGLHGWAAHLSNKMASAYGKFVDDPFRMSSILYEARAAGYRSLSDLHELTHDPALKQQFDEIARRANDQIINYELLSPGEQAMARRIIFFYPWVKGSTRYAMQLAKERPVTAAGLGITGELGNRNLEQMFPWGLPPWLEGAIPYSGMNAQGYANLGNPASAAILQEPADIAKTAVGLFQGHPDYSAAIFHNLAPGDLGLVALGTQGAYSSIPHPRSWSPLHVAVNEAFGGSPEMQLANFFLHGPNKTGLYPDPSLLHALSRWGFLGGLGARKTNIYKAAQQAWNLQHPRDKYIGG